MTVLDGYKPLCFLGATLLMSQGNRLFLYELDDERLTFMAETESTGLHRLAVHSKLLTRLLRVGVHYAIALDDNSALVAVNKALVNLNTQTGSIQTEFRLRRGRRPLSICRIEGISNFDNGHYFGEYFENNDKEPVHIYRRNDDGKWDIAYTFQRGEIDHVHSIVADPYANHVWILTGDFGQGAAIWIAENNFKTVSRAVSGGQQYRGSVAFPTPRGLLYATDSQFEPNNIRLLSAVQHEADSHLDKVWDSQRLHSINGPCIYGSQGNDRYYFSNSVEPDGMLSGNRIRDIVEDVFIKKPGPGNLSAETVIVSVNENFELDEISRYAKDIYPMALFQFGNTQFPSGQQPTGKLIYYNVALRDHDLATVVRTFDTSL